MARAKAFTLVELLVSVALIVLLVAMLVPALGRAKKQAKTVRCLANLHIWTSMLNGYLQEFGRVQPRVFQDTEFDWYYLGAGANAEEYAASDGRNVSNWKIRYCDETLEAAQVEIQGLLSQRPGQSTASAQLLGASHLQWNMLVVAANESIMKRRTGSYGENPSLHKINSARPRPAFVGGKSWGVHESEIPVFGDSTGPALFNWGVSPAYTEYIDASLLYVLMNRHGGGVNLAFLDGHAETVKTMRLTTFKWDLDWMPITDWKGPSRTNAAIVRQFDQSPPPRPLPRKK